MVDYLDTVPLAARPGMGEVHGMGDGLWAWYGRDFREVNRLLADQAEGAAPTPDALRRQAQAFKQALSLMIAQRRPSQHLLGDGASLGRLTNSYLRLMAEAGVISPTLRDAALPLPLHLRPELPPTARPDFVQRKATSALRTHISTLLDVPRAYDLERLDLEAETSLDGEAQALAARVLAGLRTPAAAKAAGLYGPHLLDAGADPSPLVYSFTLFERGPQANLLRVQADSIDQPFDVNQGARLDLGSTAKLRTLVSYLELVAELHARWAGLGTAQLTALAPSPRDPLGVWARQHLLRAKDKRLAPMLEAAMERKYSANPGEAFFTGGGLHQFENFERSRNNEFITVREGFKHSINLVFIRLMRDVVRHRMFGGESDAEQLLQRPCRPAPARAARALCRPRGLGLSDALLSQVPAPAGRRCPGLAAARRKAFGAAPGQRAVHRGAGCRRGSARRTAHAEAGPRIRRLAARTAGAAHHLRQPVAGRPRLRGARASAGAVAGGLFAKAPRRHADRCAERQRQRTARGLRLALQDAPQERARHAPARADRDRRLRANPPLVAAPGLSVRIAHAFIRKRHRRIGRPAAPRWRS